MKLKDIYELAISLGKKHDPRGEDLQFFLEEKANEFEKMVETDREYYDKEKLSNPFSDTRILVGTGEEKVEKILCGIDIETPEILLADRLNQKGEAIDLVLAHHPEGIAYAGLHEVMAVQADMLLDVGVPINIGEGIMAARISEVNRNIMPLNHQRAVDAARLLGLPFICVHSPADNMVNNFLQNLFENKEYRTLKDVIDILGEIPEYQKAAKLKAGPQIVNGDKKRRCGKIFIKMTGGTGGSPDAYEKLAEAGIGTYICMHMQEKHLTAAKKNNINVIIAGHMASDSIGMNLFLDELEAQGVEIIPCSGLIRVSRKN